MSILLRSVRGVALGLGLAIGAVCRGVWWTSSFLTAWFLALAFTDGCLRRALRMRACALGYDLAEDDVVFEAADCDPATTSGDENDDPLPEWLDQSPPPFAEESSVPRLVLAGQPGRRAQSRPQLDARCALVRLGLMPPISKGAIWPWIVGMRWDLTETPMEMDEVIVEFSDQQALTVSDPKELGLIVFGCLYQHGNR